VVTVVFIYVGCSSRNEPAPGQVARPKPGDAGSVPPGGASGAFRGSESKLFADWPTPAGALIISGEQFGYLEPCGCTEGQLGGLRRRYDLVERLRAQRWPLALVDLGSLIKDPVSARGGFEEAKIKFHIALKALALLKCDALALSAEDLKVGVDEALGQFLNLEGDHPPKILAANAAAPGLEQVIRPSLRTAAGPIKLGVTAVLDPATFEALKDPAKDMLKVKPPRDVLPGVLADLEKDTDVQVLLVQGPPDEAKTLAETFPGFDIVVSTSLFSDLLDEGVQKLNGDKTLLIQVGQKGKYAGVVGLYQDPKNRFLYKRVSLQQRYDGRAEPMRKLIEDDLQAALKQQRVVENYVRRDFVNGAPGATFAGAETCKSCHPNTYSRWASTKHAQAFEDIVRDPKGERVDHQFDAECITCHTTGFEYNSGWVSAELTPYLKGNQCENCHGPGSKHAAEPDNADVRKVMARSAAEASRGGLCNRCHDEDNSPHFNFEKYFGQIVHNKLDQYDDPKVHQGVAPKAKMAASQGKTAQ
jgi:hypothetical protein